MLNVCTFYHSLSYLIHWKGVVQFLRSAFLILHFMAQLCSSAQFYNNNKCAFLYFAHELFRGTNFFIPFKVFMIFTFL